MNWLIDIGNTRAKVCNWNNGKPTEVLACNNADLVKLLPECLTAKGRMLVSNVSSQQLSTSVEAICRKKDVDVKFLATEQEHNGVVNAYSDYKQLGVDRWLNIIGSTLVRPNQNSLVVSLGTATTIDVVTAEKHHLGGWILPGVALLQTTLTEKTSNIDVAPVFSVNQWLGKNTQDNVSSGSILATNGAVLHALTLCSQKNINIDSIILTGGNANCVSLGIEKDILMDNQLIFRGMASYF